MEAGFQIDLGPQAGAAGQPTVPSGVAAPDKPDTPAAPGAGAGAGKAGAGKAGAGKAGNGAGKAVTPTPPDPNPPTPKAALPKTATPMAASPGSMRFQRAPSTIETAARPTSTRLQGSPARTSPLALQPAPDSQPTGSEIPAFVPPPREFHPALGAGVQSTAGSPADSPEPELSQPLSLQGRDGNPTRADASLLRASAIQDDPEQPASESTPEAGSLPQVGTQGQVLNTPSPAPTTARPAQPTFTSRTVSDLSKDPVAMAFLAKRLGTILPAAAAPAGQTAPAAPALRPSRSTLRPRARQHPPPPRPRHLLRRTIRGSIGASNDPRCKSRARRPRASAPPPFPTESWSRSQHSSRAQHVKRVQTDLERVADRPDRVREAIAVVQARKQKADRLVRAAEQDHRARVAVLAKPLA